MLDNIRIVLVETSHPGNIGSAARAMKTMGLSRLYLVKPKVFPNAQATELAAGADDILSSAIVVNTLDEALSGSNLVVGTSARRRELAISCLSPEKLGAKVANFDSNHELAVVFGREKSGLNNEELLRCNYHIVIDANSEYSSLNLSQAVQVISYELRKNIKINENSDKNIAKDLADYTEVENFYEHLKNVLLQTEFLDPKNPKKLMPRIKRLFNRVELEKVEVNILRGILSSFEKALRSKG